ncbi:hypothetical protein BH09SUM1_BH09SUM1_07580 [soil metagenome]
MIFLPILAGIFLGIIGLGYRLGQARGISTPIVVLYMSACGAAYFATQTSLQSFGQAPARVYFDAIVAGLAQYVCIELVAMALARGPLSPIWCALNLVFVPVIFYAAIFFAEAISVPKFVGIALAISCVVFGALGKKEAAGAAPARAFLYFAILVAALVTNAFLHLGIKDLTGLQLMDRFGGVFFVAMYASLAAPIAVKLLIGRASRVFSRFAVASGAIAGFGSVAGFSVMSYAAARQPAAVVFTIASIMSLITASLISVAFFRERVTWQWCAMIGCAAAAVILVNV